VQAEAEDGVHEIILAGDGIEMPPDEPSLFPRADPAVAKIRHLFIGLG
jgi:hypothetical protein